MSRFRLVAQYLRDHIAPDLSDGEWLEARREVEEIMEEAATLLELRADMVGSVVPGCVNQRTASSAWVFHPFDNPRGGDSGDIAATLLVHDEPEPSP